MAKSSFDRFINKGATGAKKKEQIRLEKKQARDEKNAYFEKVKQERKIERQAQRPAPLRDNEARSSEERSQGTGRSKPYGKSAASKPSRFSDKGPSTGRSAGSKPARFGDKGPSAGNFESKSSRFGDKKSSSGKFESRGGDKRKAPYGTYAPGKNDPPKDFENGGEDSSERGPVKKYASGEGSAARGKYAKGGSSSFGSRDKTGSDKPAGRPASRGYNTRPGATRGSSPTGGRRAADNETGGKPAYSKPPVKKEDRKGGYAGKPKAPKPVTNLTGTMGRSVAAKTAKTAEAAAAKAIVPAKAEAYKDGVMPLNKYIAHAGVCSRRDAADLVKNGKVHVNGKPVLEPGFKVTIKDEIKVHGKQVVATRNFVYILLNKPKDFLTTTEDPEGRKTVMDIIKSATDERVYPIGRLDRNTTGVLLLTNDGELAQKLSHPSYEVKKIYEVKLDKPLQKKDFDRIIAGVELEDGMVAPDVLAYADSKDKSVIGIEIHSGKNRIVRRIFEHVGYDVRNLDRVMYANLTKKNVERGKWRFLAEKEVRLLKFLNASYTKKPDQKPAR